MLLLYISEQEITLQKYFGYIFPYSLGNIVYLQEIVSKNKFMVIENNREMQYNPDDIDVRLQHFILGHIIQMIKDQKIVINDDIRYSAFSWTKKQKSLFIESLLIKLPIPNFYFDGSHSPWIIIDGLQKLSAINEFVQNKFKLTSLEYLYGECENRYFKQLPGYLQARIFETKIVAYVINPGTHYEVAYNIFRRINETGTYLNDQEIRHVFFHGKASNFIKELANLPLFCELKKTKIASKRLEDQEYVNRFVSFLYIPHEYNGNMEHFLYKGMAILDADREDELANMKEKFQKALERLNQLFGDYIFRTPLPDKKWSTKWNKAIYDMCMHNILELNEHQMQTLLSHKNSFLNEFIRKFTKKGEWHSLINNSQNSPQAVIERFQVLKYLLNKHSEL